MIHNQITSCWYLLIINPRVFYYSNPIAHPIECPINARLLQCIPLYSPLYISQAISLKYTRINQVNIPIFKCHLYIYRSILYIYIYIYNIYIYMCVCVSPSFKHHQVSPGQGAAASASRQRARCGPGARSPFWSWTCYRPWLTWCKRSWWVIKWLWAYGYKAMNWLLQDYGGYGIKNKLTIGL